MLFIILHLDFRKLWVVSVFILGSRRLSIYLICFVWVKNSFRRGFFIVNINNT